jgi:hypothetical protein
MGAEKNVVKNGIKFDTFRENDDGTKFALNTYAAPVTYLEENTNLTRATWEDFTYIGAFRLQRGWKLTGGKFTAGGAIGVAGNTVYLRGRTDDGKMAIASVSIPELNPDASFEELPVAENVGEFIDIESHVEMGDNHGKNRMTSMHIHNGYIIGGMVNNYDTNDADRHMFWRYDGQSVGGLYEVEGKYPALGWITDVPEEWQERLGVTHIMGGGHNYSIAHRASMGPTAFGVNLDDLTADVVEEPVKTIEFLGYDFDHPDGRQSLFKTKYPELTEQHGWENFRFNIEQILDPECIDENGKKICSRHVNYPHPTGETLGNDIWISSARAGIGFIIPGTDLYRRDHNQGKCNHQGKGNKNTEPPRPCCF